MKSKFINRTQYNTKEMFKRAFAPRMLPVTVLTAFAILSYFFGAHAEAGISLGMASIIDVANCASPDSVFNVGVPGCDLAKKKMKGVIFADRGVAYSAADCASVASFIAATKTKTTAARGSRVYPIWDLLNFEDNTGDPSTGGIGNLTTATIITSDAIPAFRYGYNGTEARHRRIAGIIGASLDIFFVDEQFAVYGCSDNNGGIKGFSVLQAYADTSKFIVGDAINQYSFRVTLGSISEYRDSSLYVVSNSGLTAAVGLVNITMSQFSLVSNVLKVYMIADGGTNLEPAYGDILDGLTWTAKNLETGAAFTVTSVAKDDTNDVMTITLDSTLWTALASGDRVQIIGPTPAAMSAAAVKPFEFISYIVTKP